MNNQFISDNFRNMLASEFLTEVLKTERMLITVFFHQPAAPDSINPDTSPGRTGLNADGTSRGTFGTNTGLVNMRAEDWELSGDTGIIHNAYDIDVGRLNAGAVTVGWYSLWSGTTRADLTFLGWRKLNNDLRLPGGQSLRIGTGVIKIKF